VQLYEYRPKSETTILGLRPRHTSALSVMHNAGASLVLLCK